jgi:hypothetical protein
MKKLLIVISMAFLLILVGCAKKADEVELQNAETLTQGLTSMMTNVRAQGGNTGSNVAPKPQAPPFWGGPVLFPDIPEGSQQSYYYMAFRWDSAGATIDSLYWLIMLTPDVWDTLVADSEFVTAVDFWLWRRVAADVWWHFNINLSQSDLTNLTGAMKWHYNETWLNYAYTVSTDTTVSKAGLIDVTTSDDIKLSAHFEFITDGSGTGWGRWQTTEFVRWIFYAVPDPDNYEGYYTLLSESWKVKHYFPEQP